MGAANEVNFIASQKNTVHNFSIDSLKLLFAITVLFYHGYFFGKFSEIEINAQSNFLANGFFKLAIPFFFIVSGYLFQKTLSSKRDKTWYKHVLTRYILWLAIYTALFFDQIYSDGAPAFQIAKKLIRFLLFSPYHLWFIPALILASMTVWFLHRAELTYSKKLYVFCTIAWITGVSMEIVRFSTDINVATYLYRNFLFFGLPMFVAGFAIHKHKGFLLSISGRWLVYLVGIACVLVALESIAWWFISDDISTVGVDMLLFAPLASFMLMLTCLKYPNFNILGGHQRYLSMFIYYSHPLFLFLAVTFAYEGDPLISTSLALVFMVFSFFVLGKKVKRVV